MPWSVAFIRRLLPYVTMWSAIRLRKAALRNAGKAPVRSGLVAVQVRRPFCGNVWLREVGTDFTTFQEIVVKRIYEKVSLRAGECEYFIDAGANIGLTTIYFSSLFPRSRGLAVEPAAENRAVLAMNVRPLIESGRCEICEGAVWCEDTTVDLGEAPEGTGFDAIQVQSSTKQTSTRRVAAYSVDTLIERAGFPRVDILKIDVEGAETAVFRGDCKWLSKVNSIAIEFHGDSRRESGFDDVVKASGFIVEEDDFPNCVVAYRPIDRRVH